MALKTVSCIAYALCARRKGDTLGLVLDLPPTISPVDPLVNRDSSNGPKVPERFSAQPPFFPLSAWSFYAIRGLLTPLEIPVGNG